MKEIIQKMLLIGFVVFLVVGALFTGFGPNDKGLKEEVEDTIRAHHEFYIRSNSDTK